MHGIEEKNIYFIHGALFRSCDKLICGHRETCEYGSISDIPSAKCGLMAAQDFKNAFIEYFHETYKQSEAIIEDNRGFFDSLKDVTEVIIAGHSMSSIDEVYFMKIAESISENARWIISRYRHSDKKYKKCLII